MVVEKFDKCITRYYACGDPGNCDILSHRLPPIRWSITFYFVGDP